MKYRVEPPHYYNFEYDSKERFCSYWHQIREVLLLNPKEVLEIGVGNKFVSRYLKEKGINVITLDIDKRLTPDIVGTVLNLPFGNETFDVVTCCEVLEHLPYKEFSKALSEIFRVSKMYAILSLPDANRFCSINLKGVKKLFITLPTIKKPVHKFTGSHYWAIGKANYSLKKIINAIRNAGFKIEKKYRVFENPYHRFFILKK